MRCEWDDEKAASNRRKHGISFEAASEVFDDGHSISNEDGFAVGERRFKTTGLVLGVGLIVVIHTIENEDTEDEFARLISARRTERHERKE